MASHTPTPAERTRTTIMAVVVISLIAVGSMLINGAILYFRLTRCRP